MLFFLHYFLYIEVYCVDYDHFDLWCGFYENPKYQYVQKLIVKIGGILDITYETLCLDIDHEPYPYLNFLSYGVPHFYLEKDPQLEMGEYFFQQTPLWDTIISCLVACKKKAPKKERHWFAQSEIGLLIDFLIKRYWTELASLPFLSFEQVIWLNSNNRNFEKNFFSFLFYSDDNSCFVVLKTDRLEKKEIKEIRLD